MNKNKLLWAGGVALALTFAVIQFIPSPPVIIPATLPLDQRAVHRHLNFEGIYNFRDLGGYTTYDDRRVKWGTLYRSGSLHGASPSDLHWLSELNLHTLVDFRSAAEKAEEPDRLPEPNNIEVVEIPAMDNGDDSMANEIMTRIKEGSLGEIDPHELMIEGNRQFPTTFNPEYSQFIRTVLAADGKPVLWHCSAGKDRAGFGAAILLRLLGVSQEQVMADYMLSKQYSLAARKNQIRMLRLFKGEETADKLQVLMGVEPEWLQAAFDTIDERYGNFDGYVRQGLGLSEQEVSRLRSLLLE